MDDLQLTELYYALSAYVQRVYSKNEDRACLEAREETSRSQARTSSTDSTNLPAANSQKKVDDIALLLASKLLDVLKGAHDSCVVGVVDVIGCRWG